ncbi:MAG: QueT transporter family protein [Acholeplasmatales bacterium]|nr:QueT transporter family protein [Acholeplasmatales bacterium]
MKLNIKFIADSAIIAALYVALTWALAPISYGPVQFRISEVLMLLVVLNPKYAISLVIGCFIANTTSSLGWYDMVFGTLATVIAVIPMCFVKKMPIAAIFPVISNAFIVSFELGLAFDLWNGAFWYDVWTVGLGELVVLYLLGIPVMSALCKSDRLVELMELNKNNSFNLPGLNIYKVFAIAIGVLGIILFIAYPLYTIGSGDDLESFSLFKIANNGDYYTWSFIGIVVAYVVAFFLTKKIANLIITIIISLLALIPYIIVGVNIDACLSYPYYYLFVIFILIMIILPIAQFVIDKKNKIYDVTNDSAAVTE